MPRYGEVRYTGRATCSLTTSAFPGPAAPLVGGGGWVVGGLWCGWVVLVLGGGVGVGVGVVVGGCWVVGGCVGGWDPGAQSPHNWSLCASLSRSCAIP